jgi:hypothetical protein
MKLKTGRETGRPVSLQTARNKNHISQHNEEGNCAIVINVTNWFFLWLYSDSPLDRRKKTHPEGMSVSTHPLTA